MSGTRTRVEQVEWCKHCNDLIPGEPVWFALPTRGPRARHVPFCSEQCLSRWARNTHHLCPVCDEESTYETITSFETLYGERWFCSVECAKAYDAELRLDG